MATRFYKITLCIAAIAGFLGVVNPCAPYVFAQFNIGRSPGLSITLSPQSPGAYQNVTASLSGSDTLDAATISWFMDGKTLGKGIGMKTVRFETGALGEATVVQAVAATNIGELRVNKEVVPIAFDLVIEAAGYAPPFYRGKTLNAEEATVRVVALPTVITQSGALLSPDALTYTWTRNGQVVGGASGRGQNVLVLNDLYISGQAQIGVEAHSENGSLVGGAIETIQTHEPLLLMYEQDPLLGIRFERALGDNFALSRNEATFVAMPYFFSVAKRSDPTLTYQWEVNGAAIAGDQGNKNAITLRQEREGGAAEVGVGVRRLESLFESLRASVRVLFGGIN
jgi:hypothetical protein